MCGIFGLVVEGEFNEKHAKLTEALLLESQVRGRHATGVTWSSGTAPMVTVKQPVPATEFVKTHLSMPLGEVGVRVLGHCRYSTSGDWEDNANNQPLESREVSLVHNGLVSMGTKEEFEHQYGVRTHSYNDSEVILQHVLRALQAGPSVTLVDALGKALHRIHRVEPPIFALGIMGLRWPMLCVRDHIRPLWLFSIASLGVRGFASTKDIIDRVAERMQMTIEHQEVPPYTIIDVRNPNNTYPLSFEYPKEFRFQRPQLVFPEILQPEAVQSDPRLDFPVAGHLDFRKLENRLKAFLLYYAAVTVTWDVDPAYPAINYLFRRYELSKEQEYWVCWLYGVFYQIGSLFWFMQEFPEFEKVDLGRLERWHKQHWRELRYETDRRYCKGHLVDMFVSYKAAIGQRTQEEWFAELLTSEDPVVNFHNVWKEVMKFDRFGRYSAYYYTETLHRCMGMPILADTMFLPDALSSRNGLCYAVGKDQYVDAKMTKDILRELNTDLDELYHLVKATFPHITVDYWLLESALCAYKGLYRRRRYIGYYIDRLAEEICHIQEDHKESTVGVDWGVLWQMRRACFPPEYLGELWPSAEKPWLWPREDAQNAMMDKGVLVGLGPVAKRGLL
jgi:hypothetical protein